MNRSRWVWAMIIVALVLGVLGAPLALADAAPPQNPPGTTLDARGFETNVQMISEEVLIVVDGHYEGTIEYEYDDDVITMTVAGHVDATFWMQNQGEEEEAFDVWFPIGESGVTIPVLYVENFAAWVDGVPMELGQEQAGGDRATAVWATWPVTFPPGQVVALRVTYDVIPSTQSIRIRWIEMSESNASIARSKLPVNG
jgi:hypothetical protein